MLGALLCQTITAAILVAAAAAFSRDASGMALDTVPQIAGAVTSVLGDTIGRLVFAIGVSGAALVTTIVVCLTAAWAIGEVLGIHHSLDHSPRMAPWFYAIFGLILAAGGGIVASGVNLIRLSIAVGVVNALFLPFVLGLLYHLSRTALPAHFRPRGFYALLLGAIFLLVSGVGVYSGIVGALR
jgi:Mn2+/Fe2+ NRAMP family transporter